MFARIKPIIVPPTLQRPSQQANQLRCLEISIRGLGEMARIVVAWALTDDQAQPIAQGTSVMPQETYEAWENDDSFVLEWLASQLNVRITEIVVPFDEDRNPEYPLPTSPEDEDTDPCVVVFDDSAKGV